MRAQMKAVGKKKQGEQEKMKTVKSLWMQIHSVDKAVLAQPLPQEHTVPTSGDTDETRVYFVASVMAIPTSLTYEHFPLIWKGNFNTSYWRERPGLNNWYLKNLRDRNYSQLDP